MAGVARFRAAVPPIVSTAWLRSHLGSQDSKIKVIDTSWTVEKSGHDDYTKKHIPGAVFLDLNHCVKPTPTIPRNIPDMTCFQDYVRSLGVCRQSHLVLYDRSRIHASTRAWWTFRYFGHESVSVLDGGLMAWERESLETESGSPPQTERGDFEITAINHSMVVDYSHMKEIYKSRSSQIVDTRKQKHYLGLEKEPSENSLKDTRGMGQPVPSEMRRGHIPGSLHLHKDLILDADMCFHSKDKLLQLFSDHGVDVTKPLTTLCYGGHSATLVNMAAYICGQHDSSLYYGSWTEWGQLADEDMVEEGSPKDTSSS